MGPGNGHSPPQQVCDSRAALLWLEDGGPPTWGGALGTVTLSLCPPLLSRLWLCPRSCPGLGSWGGGQYLVGGGGRALAGARLTWLDLSPSLGLNERPEGRWGGVLQTPSQARAP